MRIAIREQLGLLVLGCSLVSIAVISIATWVVNHRYVVSVKADSLTLTATLYAAQLLQAVGILRSSVQAVSTRILVQAALQRWYQGNQTYANWARSQTDLQTALSGGGSAVWLLQAQVQSINDTGIVDGNHTLLRATGASVLAQNIVLPYSVNGTPAVLGQDDDGYPPSMYPSFTYSTNVVNSTYNQSITKWGNETLQLNSTILLGPWILNQTYALMSFTCAIVNTSDPTSLLGWLTVVSSTQLIQNILDSTEGLGRTGVLLVAGPTTMSNTFGPDAAALDASRKADDAPASEPIKFIFPPEQNSSRSTRHASYSSVSGINDSSANFTLGSFPALDAAVSQKDAQGMSSGSILDTHNEEGDHVAIGYSFPRSDLVDWVVLVEQSYSEVVAPLNYLRNVLVACLFGTLAVVLLMAFPAAHFFVRPIRRLREATTRSVEGSAGASDRGSLRTTVGLPFVEVFDDEKADERRPSVWRRLWEKIRRPSWAEKHSRRGSFRIPNKVADPKHLIKDELTDLTATFNEMVDELGLQYGKLEEKVAERTAQLEMSKKAAEAANEAKTLFIANISHELKTPLNGILGMCAVSMHETDMKKVQRSLGIIRRSGDLLLHLLTDLLTFSKNQVGQNIKLEEREFSLADIASQVMSIFEQQARDGFIDLRVDFDGPDEDVVPSDAAGVPTYGPHGVGRIRDMSLWGDAHRVSQVIINLVSNSLKFTPKGGSVKLKIKCLGMGPSDVDEPAVAASSRPMPSRKESYGSRMSRLGSTRGRKRESRGSSSHGSVAPGAVFADDRHPSTGASSNMSTALEINSFDPPSERKSRMQKVRAAEVSMRDMSNSPPPPPPHARQLWFEFGVEDTGPGIHPDQHAKIFEPFVQGDLGLSKKYGGTGLGLSICSQLAKLMKGSINVDSELGKGSRFVMKIPLRFVKNRATSLSSSLIESRRNSLQLSKTVDGATSYFPEPSDTRSPTSRSKRSTPTTAAPGGYYANVVDVDNDGGSEASDSEMSTHSAPVGAATLSPTRSTRLVGLSQPFFAHSPSEENGPSGLQVMEKAAQEAKESGRRVRVLVAEDNKVNQEVVLRMLKLEDIYDVTIACDGQQAFDLVQAALAAQPPTPYDLIFMDVQMPNVDGLQSTRLIRNAGYSAPIVALTAFSEESNMKECMDSGMDWFLPKPIRRPALRQVLQRFCTTIPEEDEGAQGSGGRSVRSAKRQQLNDDAQVNGVDLAQRRRDSLSKKSESTVTEVELSRNSSGSSA